MVNTLSYYSSSVAALTPTMSRRGFRASVLPPLALVQSGLLLAPMVFLTIGGVDAENTHRIPKPVRHFLLKHLFLCPPFLTPFGFCSSGSDLGPLSLLFLPPSPFCWVLCFMEFARVSSFLVAFMSLCHLDQAKPQDCPNLHLIRIMLLNIYASGWYCLYTWMDLFFHPLVRTSIRVENFLFTSLHFLSIDLRLGVDEHMNSTVFLPGPIFISICKVFSWTGTSIWKKNWQFQVLLL